MAIAYYRLNGHDKGAKLYSEDEAREIWQDEYAEENLGFDDWLSFINAETIATVAIQREVFDKFAEDAAKTYVEGTGRTDIQPTGFLNLENDKSESAWVIDTEGNIEYPVTQIRKVIQVSTPLHETDVAGLTLKDNKVWQPLNLKPLPDDESLANDLRSDDIEKVREAGLRFEHKYRLTQEAILIKDRRFTEIIELLEFADNFITGLVIEVTFAGVFGARKKVLDKIKEYRHTRKRKMYNDYIRDHKIGFGIAMQDTVEAELKVAEADMKKAKQ